QNHRTVKNYVSELSELFTIIGSTSKKDKVIKLFNGLRSSIRTQLYRARIEPETARWKQVIRAAEFHEMAEN
ncbi:hypothetical protein FPV67DRAFT_1388792, partial [Lyophyllum atratum]